MTAAAAVTSPAKKAATKAPAKKKPQPGHAIVLGNVIREISTGVEGVCLQYVERLSGSRQWSIQPEGDGTAVPDSFAFDVNACDYVDKGIADRTLKPHPDAYGIALGSEVQDVVSGISGIVTLRTSFMNGCVLYVVQPKLDKKAADKNKLPDDIAFDWQRLKVVGKGVSLTSKEPIRQPPPLPPAKVRGGPATKAITY